MRDLIAGERAPLGGATTFVLTGGATPLALVALGANGRAAADFAPIDSITRELRSGVGFEEATRLRIDPAALPATVERLLLIAFDPANRPIDTRLTIASDTLRFAVESGAQAAAVILIELYRHQGGWRMAANGQGFAVGLSAIAAAYGLDRAWCDRLNPRLQDTPDHGGRSGQSSGSGIAIEAHHILTNAHVVDGVCSITVHVGGRTLPAEAVFSDSRNDLALLRVDTPLTQVAQFRSQVGLHLGEDIVALGFPLQGLLGTGPQASAGNIAALCGIGNDSSVFQFTAPIASGNSGGPILDMAGHLIGLVSSSLNLEQIRRSGGSAENINFGIKGAMILSFLDSFGLEPQMAHDATPIGRTAVVARSRNAIARISCQC